MSLDLGRRLVDSGVVQPGELRRAVFDAVTRNKPLARALADSSTSARAFLERPVEHEGRPTVRTVVPQSDLMDALPPGLAERLLAVAIRKDPRTGTVDVAVVDPLDVHAIAEIGFHLRAPVRPIAAPLAEIERALLLVVRPKVSTNEYPSADALAKGTMPPPTMPTASPALQPAPTPASVEDAVPLVRRSRTSAGGPPSIPVRQPVTPITPVTRIATPRPMAAIKPPEDEAMPLSRRRPTAVPPDTNPFERKIATDPIAPVHVVVDFGPSAREERKQAGNQPRRGKLEPKRPPFPSLTRVLEAIDVASDRDALIAGLLRGLATTSTAAALFAPRRGKFAGIGAIGDLDVERVRNALVTPKGTIADAIARGERIGSLDPTLDRELHQALQLERFASAHVLVHPVFVADKPALLLVSYGMGDVLESSRRARVLATAAGSAMDRMLRR